MGLHRIQRFLVGKRETMDSQFSRPKHVARSDSWNASLTIRGSPENGLAALGPATTLSTFATKTDSLPRSPAIGSFRHGHPPAEVGVLPRRQANRQTNNRRAHTDLNCGGSESKLRGGPPNFPWMASQSFR